jgi:hypothetical protein
MFNLHVESARVRALDDMLSFKVSYALLPKLGSFFCFHSVFTHRPTDRDGEKRCTPTERKQEKKAIAKELWLISITCTHLRTCASK